MAADSDAVLVVVDVQVGFLSEYSVRVVPHVCRLVTSWRSRGGRILITRYIADPQSQLEKVAGETGMIWGSSGAELVPELKALSAGIDVVDKSGLSLSVVEYLRRYAHKGELRVVVCGLNTGECVLKIVMDALDAGYSPFLVPSACSSSNGSAAHQAGMTLARVLLGKSRLLTLRQAVQLL